MLYELRFRSGTVPDELKLFHEDACNALGHFRALGEHGGEPEILRDGVVISAKELASDAHSQEIENVRQTDVERLPATRQQSWGPNCDITDDSGGELAQGVRKKTNPDNQYE